jgi:hypothetical protein
MTPEKATQSSLGLKHAQYGKQLNYRNNTSKKSLDYFNNYTFTRNNFRDSFMGVLPILFNVSMYVALLIYFYGVKTTLVAMIMPASGLTVIFVFLIGAQILSFQRKRKKRHVNITNKPIQKEKF